MRRKQSVGLLADCLRLTSDCIPAAGFDRCHPGKLSPLAYTFTQATAGGAASAGKGDIPSASQTCIARAKLAVTFQEQKVGLDARISKKNVDGGAASR